MTSRVFTRRRLNVLGLLATLALEGLAAAQAPAPVPLVAPPPPAYPLPYAAPAPVTVVEEPGRMELALRAGIGFARYRETAPNLKFEAELEPYAFAAADVMFPVGRGHLRAEASAGIGSEVDMKATSGGEVFQENKFHQQVFEGSPRIRWPLTPLLDFEGGYRLTVQRLFITEIPMYGDALETVVVHAAEVGLGWHWRNEDASSARIDVGVGVNRATAKNSLLEGANMKAGGTSLRARALKQWASGFGLEGLLMYRKQNGSDSDLATLNGVETEVFWPRNTTWQLLALAGFAIF